MLLHGGRFRSVSSFPEEQCLVYETPTDGTVVWCSRVLPPESFLEGNCLKCRKKTFQKIGEMEGIQYEGQFLPLLPPWMRAEGAAVPPSPPG